jgi:hypothetical protein
MADCRQFAAKNFHDLDGCRNISSSIDHVGLTCLACADSHSMGESMSRGELVVVCISDQNFPPVLPADDGKCVVVIRVEEGRLFEIEKAFGDVFAGHCAPHGRLPQGSVVLVGSLSHLSRYGLESYAVDLVKTMASLTTRVGGGLAWCHTCRSRWGGLMVGRPSGLSSIWTPGCWALARLLEPCSRGSGLPSGG